MTISQILLTIFFSIIILIIIFRLLTKKEFYFTSYYNEEKEYITNKLFLKENILNSLKESNFKNINENINKFTAITLPTMSSFSELISVNFTKVDETKFLVQFNSKCFFPLQVFDWGKNERNSKKFYKNLDSYINN